MRKTWLASLVVFALAGTLQAQEVVHAIAGVVTAVTPERQSIALKIRDGSIQSFNYKKELKADIEFDKELRSGTLAPDAFNKAGDQVVLYYFGQGAQSTIVAIRDFGATPLDAATGVIVKDRHRDMVIKTDGGATETFEIAKNSSAETPVGVVSGPRFDPEEGQRVTVRYTQSNGTNIAEFIRAD